MLLNKINKLLLNPLLIIVFFITIPTTCLAEYFTYNASYEVCFTPGNDCASKITKTIALAKKQILVQAYIFTDFSIAKALVKAKKKGVDIQVILDKNSIKEHHALIHLLNKNKIKLMVDHLPDIAHNKVIIIDELTVIGGSYNYTNSAAKKNAENLLIIKDASFAQKYIANWHAREQKSISMDSALQQEL